MASLGVSASPARTRAAEEIAFLVLPGNRVDGEIRGFRVLGAGPRYLQPIDHAKRAVEPASLGLGVGMRADDQRRPVLARASKHVPHPVKGRVQSRFFIALLDPASSFHVGVAECWTDHPVADRSNRPQVS